MSTFNNVTEYGTHNNHNNKVMNNENERKY